MISRRINRRSRGTMGHAAGRLAGQLLALTGLLLSAGDRRQSTPNSNVCWGPPPLHDPPKPSLGAHISTVE